MRVPKVILLCGFKESGKNAVADIITKRYGHEQIAFADPLKDKLAEFISSNDDLPADMPEELVKWITVGRAAFADYLKLNQFDVADDTFGAIRLYHAGILVRQKPYREWQRRGLQLLGTEYYRKKDFCYWLKSMHLDPDQKYVITDGRFKNEAKFGRVIGALVVRVMRRATDPADPFRGDLHPSEAEVATLACDEYLGNDVDGLDNLEKEVVTLFEKDLIESLYHGEVVFV